uniref:Uncharacterized protein n=1 Tax=Oryza brachyantha TaxID=4533 RepID=J3MRI2_ORYBR
FYIARRFDYTWIYLCVYIIISIKSNKLDWSHKPNMAHHRTRVPSAMTNLITPITLATPCTVSRN